MTGNRPCRLKLNAKMAVRETRPRMCCSKFEGASGLLARHEATGCKLPQMRRDVYEVDRYQSRFSVLARVQIVQEVIRRNVSKLCDERGVD